MPSKNININGRWKRVELTEDEARDVLDNLLISNLNELQKCEEKAKDYNKNMATDLSHAQIVRMLYDKQATASYTAISNAIDEKAFRPPEEPKEHEVAPHIDTTEEKPHEPSGIDKAFEKTQ